MQRKRERVSVCYRVQENGLKTESETEKIAAPLYNNKKSAIPDTRARRSDHRSGHGVVQGRVWRAVKQRRTPSCPKGLSVDS
jgi:hypothetical protein